MKYLLAIIFVLALFIQTNAFAGEWKESTSKYSSGTITTRTWYEKGKAKLDMRGVMMEKIKKNSEWKVIEIAYFWKNRKAIGEQLNWISTKKFSYIKNRAIEVRFYWTKQEEIMDNKKCHGYIYAFDSEIPEFISTKACLFKKDDKQYTKEDADGIESYMYTIFSNSGSLSVYSFFLNIRNANIADKLWIYKYKYSFLYDDMGNIKQKNLSYYDNKNVRVTKNGIHSYTWHYRNNSVVMRYTDDINLNPVEDESWIASYALTQEKINDWTSFILVYFTNHNGEKTKDEYGVSNYVINYNSKWEFISSSCTDSQKRDVICPNITDSDLILKYKNKILEKSEEVKEPIRVTSIFQ